MQTRSALPPILSHADFDQASVFTPTNLLREARRQKRLPVGDVPDVCVLDPDGDFWRLLRESGARRNPHWACYHTEMYEADVENGAVGVVGCAVGAPFAVLVAEQMFVSGCELLISITSAGQLVPAGDPPYLVLIDRALRDEGTSYHYAPPATYSVISPRCLEFARAALSQLPGLKQGGTWTTDAPFRETQDAIAFARSEALLAVEMEAAALYALASAKNYPIVCIAHVTNVMAQVENDFEKGEQAGNAMFLQLLTLMTKMWRATDDHL